MKDENKDTYGTAFWNSVNNADEDLENSPPLGERFRNRLLSPEQASHTKQIRRMFSDLACDVEGTLDKSRELSLALTHLETACMFAVKAYAVGVGRDES